MGSVAFSNVLLLESLSMEREAQKITEMVRFSQKIVETILSETTSSIITTKRGVGMGSVAFSTVFYSKAYQWNVKPKKLRKWCDFHKKLWRLYCHVQTGTSRYIGNRVMSK